MLIWKMERTRDFISGRRWEEGRAFGVALLEGRGKGVSTKAKIVVIHDQVCLRYAL